jgi:ABC-type transport system involved in multi-copper enzyme maturation permease subunit
MNPTVTRTSFLADVTDVVRAELFKVLRKRRSFVVALLWWGLVPILTLIIGQVFHANVAGSFVDEAGGVDALVQEFASPFGLARVALVGPAYLAPTFYIIVIALFAALLIGEERGHGMWKTVLVAQPRRSSVLLGKVLVAMIVLAALLGGAFVSSLLVGAVGTALLPTTWAGAWGELLGLYALQWAYAVAAVLFAFLMVFVARNVALGVVLVFFLPPLLEALYSVYRTLIGFQPVNRLNIIFQTLRLRQTLEDLPRYFFTNNLYAPARAPVAELTNAFTQTASGPGGGDMAAMAPLLGAGITLPHAAAVMAGYAILFGVLLTWAFLRFDVD